MTDEEAIAGTLAWCNERRVEKGMEPLADLPKGQLHKPDSCPCGKATGLKVFSDYYLPADYYPHPSATKVLDVPFEVTTFVERFDMGRLPQYQEEGFSTPFESA